MISFLPWLHHECPNSDLIQWIIWGLVFLIVVVIFNIIMIIKFIKAFQDMEVQNKVLQRDLELNAIIKHEHIQKLLCPHDLLTYNDEHIYTVNKCSTCNKQCKKECWTQYFIDKLNKNKEEIQNGNCN